MPIEGRPRAVVLGAGFAGAMAARACAAAGFEVTVVDKDEALDQPRAGAPHADQLHNVLGRAQRHLIELVPDAVARFDELGGIRARVSSATHVFELGRRMPERDLGLEIWSAPKRTIDAVARDGLDEVATLSPGHRADGLVIEGGRTVGVTIGGAALAADLVVDALGARSPLSSWLGDQAPSVRTHVVRQWYATVTMSLPDADHGAFWLTFPSAPRSRGGLASPLGDGVWNMSLSGGPDDPTPRTVAEFLDYAATLEDPAVADLLRRGSTALSPVRTFGKPEASWRRYDLTALPTGLVSVGDAVADLNPLMGQGLSVAAWHAGALAAALTADPDLTTIGARFSVEAAEAVQAAWDLMTVFTDEARLRFEPDAWDEVARRIEDDPFEHRRYVEVWHLLRPVEALR